MSHCIGPNRPQAQHKGDSSLFQTIWGSAHPGALRSTSAGCTLQTARIAVLWNQQFAPLSAPEETEVYKSRWWSKSLTIAIED